jgi:hypothetical protein
LRITTIPRWFYYRARNPVGPIFLLGFLSELLLELVLGGFLGER